MKTLLIDDFRTFDVTKICRNYDSGIHALENESWDRLYLDHDLNDFQQDPDGELIEHTGYTIMCWLEEHPEHMPKDIEFVTANPVGREKMERVYRKIQERDDN